jgi:hypothetical protein
MAASVVKKITFSAAKLTTILQVMPICENINSDNISEWSEV